MGYGCGEDQTLYVGGRIVDCEPMLHFQWRHADGEWHDVESHLIGSYNLQNMLAAATIGTYFGVEADSVSHALAAYMPSNNRSQLEQTADNRLIVDAYNANPTSMTAALKNFSALHAANKMCIIGDMKELGSVSHDEHQRIVDLLASSDVDTVWLVGDEFEHCATTGKFRKFANVSEVKDAIAAGKPRGKYILVKGSNSTRLYELPQLL